MNRFDRPVGQQYTSTYVPLPLQQIGSLAKQYQDQYRAGQSLPQELDVLGQSLKVAPVDYENKEQYLNDYRKQLNDVVSTAKPEDYAKPDYQSKVNNILFRAKNDPRLNAMQSNKEVFDKVYTPYLNSKESKKDLVLTDILTNQHPTGYKQLRPGEALAPLDYVQHEDALKGAKTIMDDIKIDGKSFSDISQWNKDNNYFLNQDDKQRFILEQKVRDVAKANVGNYAENSEGRFRFKSLLHNIGADPHMSYSEFINDNHISEQAKQYIDQELTNDLFNYGSKQIFKDSESSKKLTADQVAIHAAKKKQDESAGIGLGQTVPGTNVDTYTSVPDKLKPFVKDDGSFDWSAMGGGSKYEVKDRSGKTIGVYNTSQEAHAAKQGDPYASITQTSTKEGSVEDHKELRKYVKDSAKLLGLKTDNLKADDYSEIIQKRKAYDSILHSEYQFTPAEQKVEKNSILNNRNNYAAFDENGKSIDNPLLDPKVAKTFQPDRKSYSDDKVQTKGTYIDDNGELKKVTFRSLSTEKNAFFDSLSKTQKNTASYVRTGEVNDSVKPYSKDIKKALELPDNIDVVDVQQLGKHNFITVADKTNRGETTTYEIMPDQNGGLKPYMVGKVSDLHKLAEKYWYLETSEGQAELQSLPSNTTLYKEVSEEEIPE